MRTSPSKSVRSRRLAAAVVLPGLLATSLVLVQPAVAATTSATGICNGVVNQLAHRGAVQENLLKAAARKNADAIAALQAERANSRPRQMRWPRRRLPRTRRWLTLRPRKHSWTASKPRRRQNWTS